MTSLLNLIHIFLALGLTAGIGAKYYRDYQGFLVRQKEFQKEQEEKSLELRVNSPDARLRNKFGLVVPVEKYQIQLFKGFAGDQEDLSKAQKNGVVEVSLSIGFKTENDSEVLEELKVQFPVLRDLVFELFSKKTSEELVQVQVREDLKNQLKKDLKDFFKNGEVQNIYLSGFLVH